MQINLTGAAVQRNTVVLSSPHPSGLNLALIISLGSRGNRNALTKQLFLLSGFPTVLGVLYFNFINCLKAQPCAKCHLFFQQNLH